MCFSQEYVTPSGGSLDEWKVWGAMAAASVASAVHLFSSIEWKRVNIGSTQLFPLTFLVGIQRPRMDRAFRFFLPLLPISNHPLCVGGYSVVQNCVYIVSSNFFNRELHPSPTQVGLNYETHSNV